LIESPASFFSYLASFSSPLTSILVGKGSEDMAGYTAGMVTAFGTTLFLVTGTLMTSFFSYPVDGSFVVTSFVSSSTTGITSCVAF